MPKLSDVLREMALFMMAQALVPVLATMVQLNLLLEGSPLRVLTTFKARGHQPAKAVSKKVTETAPVRVGPNILPTETAKSLATTDELWTQVSCATSTKSTSQFKNSAARAESDPTSRLALRMRPPVILIIKRGKVPHQRPQDGGRWAYPPQMDNCCGRRQRRRRRESFHRRRTARRRSWLR